jgi:hypothetical protein
MLGFDTGNDFSQDNSSMLMTLEYITPTNDPKQG